MADSLSRVGHLMALQNVATVQPVWIQEVINSYATDPKAQTLEHLQEFTISSCHSYFFLAKTEKTFSNSSPSQVAIYAKFGKRASARIYVRSYPPRIRPY